MIKASFDVLEGTEALITFLGCTLTRAQAMFRVQRATGSPAPRR